MYVNYDVMEIEASSHTLYSTSDQREHRNVAPQLHLGSGVRQVRFQCVCGVCACASEKRVCVHVSCAITIFSCFPTGTMTRPSGMTRSLSCSTSTSRMAMIQLSLIKTDNLAGFNFHFRKLPLIPKPLIVYICLITCFFLSIID